MAKAINSRQKGKAGELELAKLLREYGFTNARRGQQFSGANGDADIEDAIPGVHIECKRVEHLNIDSALEQSVRDARAGEIPVVIHRKNRQSWRITMYLEDFLKYYEVSKNA